MPLLVPVALLLAIRIVPLAAGQSTLLLRDVLNTHLALRATLAEGLREGEVPLVDPLRAGGQPLAGNPNAVPFYPDNLLLRVASPLWQLNAHFWLHWLVAFAAAVWLGRAWGLGREGAAAAGATYAFSGFFLSQLNLYNGVAAAALAPALAAALCESGETATRRRGLVAAGAIWGLALLGGDPILAALALAAGVVVAVARRGRSLPWLRLAGALACGTALAAPQIVETLRILGDSYRGFWGYDAASQARTAPSPGAAIDLLLPLFFGRPDLRQVWGTAYFGGFPPLYFSLAPGWIALVLALCAAGRTRRALVLAALVAVGLAVSFSGGAPWWGAVASLPGGELFRFPVKLALWAALGGSLLAGLGLERVCEGHRGRWLLRGLGVAALAGAALWGLLSLGRALPGEGLWTEGLAAGALGPERVRWAGILLLSTLAAATALALWRLLPHRFRVPALLAVHAGAQLVLLAPMLPVDRAAGFETPPALARELPAGARLAHAGVGEIFGPGWGSGVADPRLAPLLRRAHDELHPFAGRPLGFGYELDVSPDGLDAFVTHAIARGMRNFSDARRVAVLEALGVERLLVFRPLDPAAETRARPERAVDIDGSTVRIYEILRSLPPAALIGDVVFAPTMNAALEAVFAPGFAAPEVAVVAGEGSAREAPPGEILAREESADRVALEVDSPAGGFVVLRRAHRAFWRATVDGEPAPTRIAQLTRLAVEVPAGRHRVELRVPRAPRRWAWLASALGLVGLIAFARAGRTR